MDFLSQVAGQVMQEASGQVSNITSNLTDSARAAILAQVRREILMDEQAAARQQSGVRGTHSPSYAREERPPSYSEFTPNEPDTNIEEEIHETPQHVHYVRVANPSEPINLVTNSPPSTLNIPNDIVPSYDGSTKALNRFISKAEYLIQRYGNIDYKHVMHHITTKLTGKAADLISENQYAADKFEDLKSILIQHYGDQRTEECLAMELESITIKRDETYKNLAERIQAVRSNIFYKIMQTDNDPHSQKNKMNHYNKKCFDVFLYNLPTEIVRVVRIRQANNLEEALRIVIEELNFISQYKNRQNTYKQPNLPQPHQPQSQQRNFNSRTFRPKNYVTSSRDIFSRSLDVPNRPMYPTESNRVPIQFSKPYPRRRMFNFANSSQPIQDCLHLQLYRDPKDRFKKGQTKASLSLQQFLGFESGFTLDKESNTIAIICQDVVVVLAFETRERLIAWQVKVGGQLGASKEFLVLIGGGTKKLPPGPARLHVQGRKFAITSGLPPRLLGLWELVHLRRYGVVEGRFCFEGGSLCGKGEGLHVLITDQAQDITDAFDLAARGNNVRSTPSRKSADKRNNTRSSTRMSDFNTVDQSFPDTASGLYEENFFGEDCGRVSPYWPSDDREAELRRNEDIGAKPPWSGADHVTLERCSNCLTKLGVSRSSTVALTPTTHFNPAWTMEAVPESSSDSSSNNTEYLTPRMIRKTLAACQCKDKPPQRPPKPGHLETKKPPAPLPSQCPCLNENFPVSNPKVGPYENYDVPKSTPIEQVDNAEYYDTPKRIKQALAEDLFQVTQNSSPGSLVLKKNCGCILKFGSRKKPVIVECNENLQPVDCPCQKVTNWANNLISLPYCKREQSSDKVSTELLTSQKSEEMAIYATVDMSRKTNRQSGSVSENPDSSEPSFTNYQNVEPTNEHDVGPYANYENLEFALSLEYYENAKDLLKKAGVTQSELDALSANIEMASNVIPKKARLCTKCVHSQHQAQETVKTKTDEYLLMEPANEKREPCRTVASNPGYTPMSPNPNWSQSLKHPLHKLHKVEIEKSLSIPTLNGSEKTQSFDGTPSNNNKEAIQKRSSSVDSARLLEDLKEFDSSVNSHATSSSLETLRNLAIDTRRSSSPCDNDRECYDCCKSSGSENKTEESGSKAIPHLRNKLMDNAQIKRSSSVPCKGGNRDSSSSNDSGVSSCSMKHGGEFTEFEMPLTSGQSRHQYMMQRRTRGSVTGCLHASLPRKSRSSDLLRDQSLALCRDAVSAKSSSAEAEVPVLPPKQFKGVLDTHSTSSGTSDMSDYIETLSLTSSHSSSDTQSVMRIGRQPTSTLRPRSGKEYHNIDPIITSMYKTGKELANYTNLQ